MLSFPAQVTLHARRGIGNVLGSTWEGRTFFISLRSPDVVVPNRTTFAASASAALRHQWPPVGAFSAPKGTVKALAAAESFNEKPWALRPKAVEPPESTPRWAACGCMWGARPLPAHLQVHAADVVPILPHWETSTETSTQQRRAS